MSLSNSAGGVFLELNLRVKGVDQEKDVFAPLSLPDFSELAAMFAVVAERAEVTGLMNGPN